MKRLVRLLFFLFTAATSYASHIVGADMELVYQGRGYNYEVRMNMYFDDINATPGLLEADLVIYVNIFQKSNNEFKTSVRLERVVNEFVTYTSNGCADPGIVRTRRFLYKGIVNLEDYTNAQGYYLSWQRCCRNYVSKNIYHDNIFGQKIAGQVFYLEFPPVIKNGQRFYNSSPVFDVIPAEYLCKGSPYVVSFAGRDLNGDSLVYSLVTPMQGSTNDLVIISNSSAPYDSVNWKPGYGRLNMIPGTPPLRVDKHTGILSVTPSDTGLFVFAIRVEEFRKGVKIGEARRDFQYLVLNCPPNPGTKVGLDNPQSNPNFNADTLIVPINAITCANIFVTDSVFITKPNSSEAISILTIANSKIRKTFTISQENVELTPGAGDTTSISMCFNPCDIIEPQQDTLVEFYILVKDNECPAKFDSLKFWVKYTLPSANIAPLLQTDLPSDTVEVLVDSLLQFIVFAKDPDNDDLYPITAAGDGFDLSFFGMNFSNTYLEADSAAGLFTWKPTCDILKSNPEVKVTFRVKDKSCRVSHQKQKTVLFRIRDNTTDLPDLLPYNLVTSNGDAKNDCFAIPGMPPDNCEYQFKGIEIYNRWGSSIYKASKRDFSWCPEDQSDGVYYYYIDLNKKRIKGWIQLIR